MPQLPVKLFHPANPVKPADLRACGDADGIRYLTARTEAELAGLLRIGWQLKPEPKTIEGGPVRLVEEN